MLVYSLIFLCKAIIFTESIRGDTVDLAILCFVIFPGSKKLFPSFNFFCKCCCVARLVVSTEVGL